MANPLRIEASEYFRRQREEGMLLACAYDDEQTCQRLGVMGAMTLPELEARLNDLDPGRPIALICTEPDEERSAKMAAELRERGFPSAFAVRGGADAIKETLVGDVYQPHA